LWRAKGASWPDVRLMPLVARRGALEEPDRAGGKLALKLGDRGCAGSTSAETPKGARTSRRNPGGKDCEAVENAGIDALEGFGRRRGSTKYEGVEPFEAEKD